jgi:hypothetical protein
MVLAQARAFALSGEAGEPPAQLDRRRQFALLI